ncbi:MAG: type III-B CRISPR module RAMP protein Cmr4 [Chloroflexales bacterium]|nr:type III-B CRISPR module RAMP protein Cmr4 [Chloroflexales bacterium]
MTTHMLFTHALSPLHPGTGQGTGVIDLPIAREKATGLPYLPGSSLKGTLRSACPDDQRVAIFGPDTNAAHEHAGAVVFADQRLLLLPIRSLAGTFAWVTSPYVLRRFARDAGLAGMKKLPGDIDNPTDEQICLVTESSQLRVSGDAVYLEDLDLEATSDQRATAWADWLAPHIFADGVWQLLLKQRLCVVHDNLLGFLLNTATEITARVKLEEQSKTVKKGGLWYEEALPTETVLAGPLMIMPNDKTNLPPDKIAEIIGTCAKKPLQLGGKMTVGRGLCRVSLREA